MKKAFLIILFLLAPCARAEFRAFGTLAAGELPPLNFCAEGKFLIYTGNCRPGQKNKDAISRRACDDVVSALGEGLSMLYPNASVEPHADLTAAEVMGGLMKPGVLGFFFVGEGDTKGAFITGPELEKVYPNISACKSSYDLFGGFTSHSKYSPSAPAPKAERGLVLSRTETLYSAAGAMPDSWTKLCKPRLSLVYPTRTFSGRMKDDIKKFLELLQEGRKKRENDCSAPTPVPSR